MLQNTSLKKKINQRLIEALNAIKNQSGIIYGMKALKLDATLRDQIFEKREKFSGTRLV